MASRPQNRSFRHTDVNPDEVAWDQYLRKLAEPSGPLSHQRVQQIEDLWEHLQRQVIPLPLPYAMASEAGEFVMTWDRGPHHFEIELLTNEKYDWFYLDRTSGEHLGEDEHPLGTLSAEMVLHLQRTVA